MAFNLGMIATALAMLLQFGSCQATPDRSRTAAEAADIFLDGIEERDQTALWWVVKPGTVFTIDGQPYADEVFYASLVADTSPRQNLVIVSLTSTATEVGVSTVYGNDPKAKTRTTLTFADGCITAVAVDH